MTTETVQHTLGPWKVVEFDDVNQMQIQDADGVMLAMQVANYGDAQDRANARLIAAAPTMADYIEYVSDKIDLGEMPLTFAEWQDFNESAR